ncbi:MAG: DEAD/DEAH box helicase, partial [Candidatus Omnitrophota bacterium]
MMQNQAQTETFYGLGIVPKILEVLARLKFTKPTPIQFKAIPSAIDRKDVIGVAQTGTGKTLAFCVPMIQHLIQKRGRGLVLVPTRELAIQVNETFHKVGVSMGIHTAVLIGGASMYHQIQSLRRHPQVIIATPGRLIDHLERRTVFL